MTRRRFVLGAVLTVGLLAGFAINSAWQAYRGRAGESASSSPPPAASRSSSALPPVGTLTPPRLVHASLGAAMTSAQTADAAHAALRDLVQWVGSHPGGDIEALVLVGSFGAPGMEAAATVKRLFDVLEDVPAGTPVYVVPGHRQLAAGETLAAALKADTDVIVELQKQLLGNDAGPRALIDLSACYRAATSDGSGCVARLPGRQVRLVGYPAYALPPVVPPATPNAELAKEQEQWRGIFQKAMALAPGAGTLLVTPLVTPVARYWTGTNQTSWMAIARGAGHALGVDAALTRRRPAYEADEAWTEDGLEGHWRLTPPLLAPDGDRGAAQGATLVTFAGDGTLSREVFWYDPPAVAFRSNTLAPAEPAGPRGLWEHVVATISYLWGLGPATMSYLWGLGPALDPLPRASMFFIALLAAFLTVAAVWDIPPPTTGTVTITTPGASGAAQTGTTVTIPQSLMDRWAPASLLQQNLTKTVLSGLGGLAVATLTLETVGQDNKSEAQAFYLVWFIIWFVFLLTTWSAVRGGVEGLRALAYVGRQRPVESASGARNALDLRWLTAWLPSLSRLQWFAIVASDAFFNLIQGKNQLQNTIWASEIRNFHEDVVLAIDRVAEHVRAGVFEYVAGNRAAGAPKAELSDIRVAVSLLSADAKRVYLVSWPPESSSKEFGLRSVAYVAVAGSVTRWWVDGLAGTLKLYDNTSGELTHLDKKELTLAEHFETRAGRDYAAFIVFPVPSRPAAGSRRAGLHISFKLASDMELLWPDTALAKAADFYPGHAGILDATPAALERLLRQSLHVIESVTRSFNESVFEQAMRSRRRG